MKKKERILDFWVSTGFFLVENPGNEQSRNKIVKRSSILKKKELKVEAGGIRHKSLIR